jgi:hypothetical protein
VAVTLSVIVPVYNEEANVLPLAAEVARALEGTGTDYELVLVDDASRDATWMRIQEARVRDARVRGLRHERNAGQSAALWTGVQGTDSRWIATLDGDLQNDPGDLPRMLRELETCDFVCGMRLQRQDSFVRRASSAVARWARPGRPWARTSATPAARCASSGANVCRASFVSTACTDSCPSSSTGAVSEPARSPSTTAPAWPASPNTASETGSGAEFSTCSASPGSSGDGSSRWGSRACQRRERAIGLHPGC